MFHCNKTAESYHFGMLLIIGKLIKTRVVLVFASDPQNNVDPACESQKKVNYVQLIFALIIFELSHLDDIII